MFQVLEWENGEGENESLLPWALGLSKMNYVLGGIKISVKEDVGASWGSSGPHPPVIQLECGRQHNRVTIGYNRRRKLKHTDTLKT